MLPSSSAFTETGDRDEIFRFGKPTERAHTSRITKEIMQEGQKIVKCFFM